jgi:hypothetical protein
VRLPWSADNGTLEEVTDAVLLLGFEQKAAITSSDFEHSFARCNQVLPNRTAYHGASLAALSLTRGKIPKDMFFALAAKTVAVATTRCHWAAPPHTEALAIGDGVFLFTPA